MMFSPSAALAAQLTHNPAAPPLVAYGAAVAAQNPLDPDLILAWGSLSPDRVMTLLMAFCLVVLLFNAVNTMRLTTQLGRQVESVERQTKTARRQAITSSKNQKAIEAVPAVLTSLNEGMQASLSKMDTLHSAVIDVRQIAKATDSGILKLTELFAEGRTGAMEAFTQLLDVVRSMGGQIDTMQRQLVERDAAGELNRQQRDDALRGELAKMGATISEIALLLEQALAHEKRTPEAPGSPVVDVKREDPNDG